MSGAELIIFGKYVLGFGLVTMAAYQFAVFFKRRFKFPLITGLILLGILAGKSLLGFVPDAAINQLEFITDLSLAIIAFSAGVELHLNEMRSRMQSIRRMTIAQLALTFLVSTLVIYLLSDRVEFLRHFSAQARLAVAMLFGTVFVARSPSSAVAIINEMRSRGPFTKTVLGVTVLIDVLVIVLFSLTFAYARAVIHNVPTDAEFFLLLLAGIGLTVIIGLVAGLFIRELLRLHLPGWSKKILLLLVAYGIYALSHYLENFTEHIFHNPLELEPLLAAIVASFYVVNYTPFRQDFEEYIEEILPVILVLFFTLTGASLSLQTLLAVLGLAVLFFMLRLLGLIAGNAVGVFWSRDPRRYYVAGWMPYVTQAGVAVGLAALVGNTFPDWGKQFETVVIAMIVLNQLVGPPLFKFALEYVHEAHKKPHISKEDRGKTACVFSYDSVSLTLAKSLRRRGWNVCIVTSQKDVEADDIPVYHVDEYSPLFLKKLDLDKVNVFVLLHPDDRVNYRILEWLYENKGPENVIAMARSAKYIEAMEKLGAKTVEPMTALVNMLEHMVRSPQGVDILLGTEGETDTVDVEVKNPDLVGLHIRDLKLPHDVIVLSLKRRNNAVFTHGYTRLRKGDILTVVGTPDSLEQVIRKLEGE